MAPDESSLSVETAELPFEEAMARLEAIVHDLEEGRLPLAEALGRYEQGVALLKRCHFVLEAAEQRIELLTGVDAQCLPVTAAFDHSASASQSEGAKGRSRRRTAQPSAPPEPCPEERPSLF